MENNRLVEIKSMSNSTVAVSDMGLNVRRIWNHRGMKHALPFNVVEQLLWSTGFRNMIESGTLYIENMKDKIDLGLEQEDAKEPTQIRVLNDSQMLTMLKIKSVEDFTKDLEGLPIEQVNLLVQYAVDNEIIDTKKSAILKEITGKDIVKLVARKHESEEIDKAIADKEERRKRDFR